MPEITVHISDVGNFAMRKWFLLMDISPWGRHPIGTNLFAVYIELFNMS